MSKLQKCWMQLIILTKGERTINGTKYTNWDSWLVFRCLNRNWQKHTVLCHTRFIVMLRDTTCYVTIWSNKCMTNSKQRMSNVCSMCKTMGDCLQNKFLYLPTKMGQNTPGNMGWSRPRDRTLAVKSRKIAWKFAFVKKLFKLKKKMIYFYISSSYAKIWVSPK